MQFRGKLTEEDLKDAQRVARKKSYWVKLLLSNWYGILLFCAVLWGTVAGLLGATNPNWPALGIIWIFIVGIVAWSVYSTKRAWTKQYAQLSAALPDWIDLVDDGIRLNGPDAATAFKPWSNFKGSREGKRVMLLDTKMEGLIILPVADLSEMERESLRQMLRAHISGVTAAPVG